MDDFSTGEQQLISSLLWFRTRYALFANLDLNRKANKQNLESFGKTWIGAFKADWSNVYDHLIKEGILVLNDGEYTFTDFGQSVAQEIDRNVPFFQYEYDQFFHSEKSSKSHSLFCAQVYGKDLSQHGLIDQNELEVLVKKLENQSPNQILDLGCGNGKITTYLANQIKAQFYGIDISKEAIQSARIETVSHSNINFEVGNLNALNLDKKYDAILFLDTLYYVNDLSETLLSSLKMLNNNGRIYAYFSQWIMDKDYSKNLLPKHTHLGKALIDLELKFSHTNLTESGIRHWKRKLQVLEALKKDFIQEGNERLWFYRYGEAKRYADWGEGMYARYFYEIRR